MFQTVDPHCGHPYVNLIPSNHFETFPFSSESENQTLKHNLNCLSEDLEFFKSKKPSLRAVKRVCTQSGNRTRTPLTGTGF